MEGDTMMMQDLFEFHRTGVGPGGKVLGNFRHRHPLGLYRADRSRRVHKARGAAATPVQR